MWCNAIARQMGRHAIHTFINHLFIIANEFVHRQWITIIINDSSANHVIVKSGFTKDHYSCIHSGVMAHFVVQCGITRGGIVEQPWTNKGVATKVAHPIFVYPSFYIRCFVLEKKWTNTHQRQDSRRQPRIERRKHDIEYYLKFISRSFDYRVKTIKNNLLCGFVTE